MYCTYRQRGLTSFIATCSLLYKFFPAMAKQDKKNLATAQINLTTSYIQAMKGSNTMEGGSTRTHMH